MTKKAKTRAIKALESLLQAKLAASMVELEALTEARNSDTKSSAGDKHETGRAMMQIEVDNAARQLQKIRLLKNEFDQIDFLKESDTVTIGSYVVTSQVACLISVGLGRISGAPQPCFAISAGSPLGKSLIGRSLGEAFTFQGKEQKVLFII